MKCLLTLSVVSDHYPIHGRGVRGAGYPKNSIRQIPGVWEKFKLSVLDKELSLNDIEHKILRLEFKVPGIHVALVCAARSWILNWMNRLGFFFPAAKISGSIERKIPYTCPRSLNGIKRII